ncbi:hypothetical protein XU18_2745 [Perkinsela sp. CCAP 1560/4]|nr:hypothetical protein XU18_2745 [Perkinsela sp. CCAP 1560/4]|eukprot:KNH06240.1 hypothetical protein XU18_2745 [Perkinsela sp. CCAP 1560/4]
MLFRGNRKNCALVPAHFLDHWIRGNFQHFWERYSRFKTSSLRASDKISCQRSGTIDLDHLPADITLRTIRNDLSGSMRVPYGVMACMKENGKLTLEYMAEASFCCAKGIVYRIFK